MKRFTFAALLLALTAGMYASAQDTSAVSDEQRKKAVGIMRILNTAELQCFLTAKTYGSIEDLRSAGLLEKARSLYPALADMPQGDEPIPGFTVRLNTSDDKKHYQLSITPDASPYAFGFFSDERGLIYEGHPLQ